MAEDYEALGPERFQVFCQALLQVEHRNVQCLPVAQPDGGRDAFIDSRFQKSRESTIFQVKFSRDPGSLADPVKWIIDTIEGERPKIERLAKRGLTNYYILTNLAGTAHLDVGRVDRVERVLKTFPVPAQCLWRDDLSIRLKNAPHLRWEFVELLQAGNLLDALLHRDSTTEKDKRIESVLRSYLSKTFADDKDVRFRQIDLRNDLMSLFVDVPATIKAKHGQDLEQSKLYREALTGGRSALLFGLVQDYRFMEVEPPGVVRALLNKDFQSAAAWVVLEGAPGQGKSTVVQYLSQFHRGRLLGEPDPLNAAYPDAPVRLPLKVELRDFAVWLGGRDPFVANRQEAPPDWAQSLESFLAAHIRNKSGGRRFSIDDLHRLVEKKPIVLVLDGLDEVAEISLREKVVSLSTEGCSRLAASAQSLQVIATSRPAAFASSPGFSPRHFEYIELGALTRELTMQYAEKWCASKQLTPVEAGEVTRTISDKLGQSHIRDLSRNTMQLAILLSLINTLGVSLPDARTSMYDEYVKLFFNRESEKSAIVNRHRVLLIDIHRYLAWVLQSGVELERPQGTISVDDLRSLVSAYLGGQGRDMSTVEELFQGMVERVVALVQRVEGLYEFEVQPLREYFCARFLYDEAPVSTAARPKPGTVPDRFDGLAQNPYWLNVTRFFSGCYNKGELGGLADSLTSLYETDSVARTSQPRTLLTNLVGDYVFAQDARVTKRIAALLISDLGQRHALETDATGGSRQYLRLPDEPERRALVGECLRLLDHRPKVDRRRRLGLLAGANGSTEELGVLWLRDARKRSGRKLTDWFNVGALTGALRGVAAEDLGELLVADDEVVRRHEALLRSGAHQYFESSADRFSAGFKSVIGGSSCKDDRRVLGRLSSLLSDSTLQLERFVLQHARLRRPLVDIPDFASDLAATLRRAEDALLDFSPDAVERFITILSEAVPKHSWAATRLAVSAASVLTRTNLGREFGDLYDEDSAFASRARYARLRSGSAKYWVSTLDSAETTEQTQMALAICLRWSTDRTLTSLQRRLEGSLEGLTPSAFGRLIRLSRHDVRASPPGMVSDLRSPSERLTIILRQRLSTTYAHRVRRSLRSAHTEALYPSAHGDYFQHEFLIARRRHASPGQLIKLSAEAYRYDIALPWYNEATLQLSASQAASIVDDAQHYPLDLVHFAEQALAGTRPVPIATVAARDGWFKQ